MNWKDECMPSHGELRRLLDYAPETGELRWTQDAKRNSGHVAGCKNSYGYRVVVIGRRNYFAHRLIWKWMTGEWPAFDIDHRNCDKSDNRWCNLRPATRSQNVCNAGLRSDNKSGHKGVYFSRAAGKWQAHIRVDGVKRHLGTFETKEAAVNARKRAAVTTYKEFAKEQ